MKFRYLLPLVLSLVASGSSRIAAQRTTNAAPPFDIPAWAFPTTSPGVVAARPPYDTLQALRVPGSAITFTLAQVKDALNPPDWFPASHAPAPNAVIHGRPEVKYACGLCHLPDGQGRSENATIVGLPEEYFLRQLADMKSGARKSAKANFASAARMSEIAAAITDEEAMATARYFGKMRAKARYRVVETATVPGTYETGGLLAFKSAADSEPIAGRLLEVSNDIERHELRDAGETFTTFVPPGSIARGLRIAVNAPAKGVSRCATCHGKDLRGIGLVPPIAGRSPAYLLRQLIAFRTGSRTSSTSAPMQLATAALSLDDMVAVAAYAGSRKP